MVSEKAFFSTQTFSIQKYPDKTPGPKSPSGAYTVFAKVSTDLPGNLPADPHVSSGNENLGLGLGVTGAVLALVIMVGVLLFVRKKRKMQAEVSRFSACS